MLLEFKTAITEKLLQIPSAALKREIRTYDKKDMAVVNRKDDETTRHWDLFIAACIAWQMRLYATPKIVENQRKQQRAYSRRLEVHQE